MVNKFIFIILSVCFLYSKSDLYLTVDDGPNSSSIPIAKTLLSNNIQAVWFITGNSCDSEFNVKILRFLITNNFIIGNHTKQHFYYTNYYYKSISDDIEYIDNILETNFYFTPRLFRPPYGEMDETSVLFARFIYNKEIIPWTDQYEEYIINYIHSNISRVELTNKIMQRSRKNNNIFSKQIILIHSTYTWSSILNDFIKLNKELGNFIYFKNDIEFLDDISKIIIK